MNDNALRLQVTGVDDAGKRLDDIAAQIQALMEAEGPVLTVTASGQDEVSQRVSSTLNEVHKEFVESLQSGYTEFREVAAALRAHSGRLVATDRDFAL